MCVRGLKHYYFDLNKIMLKVARRVRAWIETAVSSELSQVLTVARRVRAWIETAVSSELSQVLTVARRVRAWIETKS